MIALHDYELQLDMRKPLPEVEPNTFAYRLRDACRLRGYDPQEPTRLAKRVGLSTSLLHKWIHGYTTAERVPAHFLFVLADALDVNARWLIYGPPHDHRAALARTHAQFEVLALMKRMRDEDQAMVARVAAGLAPQDSTTAPVTGRFAPIGKGNDKP